MVKEDRADKKEAKEKIDIEKLEMLNWAYRPW